MADAGAPVLDLMRRQFPRLGDRAAAGAGHHARGIDARRDERVEQHRALFRGERVRFAIGAEHGEPAVLRKEPLAMRDEALFIGRQIGFERGDDGRQYAADALGHGILRKAKYTKGKRLQ